MSPTGPFVDRRRDLSFLEDRWARSGLELIVVTGRRRVGKTMLLKEFMQGKPHVYHLVNQEEGTLQLRRFRDALVEVLGGPTPEVGDWHDLFAYLSSSLDEDDRFLLIVDEFPYLVEGAESIPSYFQALLDEHLAGTEAFVCLSGSSIGMMEESVLAPKSPLYGRRTGRIDLAPFDLAQASELFTDLGLDRLVPLYGVFGGTPHYLQFVDGQAPLAGEIERLICDPRGALHDEPELLVGQEFRRPHRYVSIMEAIAAGRTTPKAISDHTGIDRQSVPKYLGELQRVRLIDHTVPVTEEGKRSRRGIYALGDPFFRFWYRFVAPHASHAEADPEGLTEQRIMPELPAHTGVVFEQACRELAPRLFGGYGRFGGWWYRETEIDIVGLDDQEGRILFCECKWQDDVDARGLLDELQAKAEEVAWRQGAREERYAIIAKSFEHRPEGDRSIRCLDLADLAAGIAPS